MAHLSGLKFGKKIYFEGGGGPSPAKKGRSGMVQGGQRPQCQVEGCKVDLSDAKAYYCRHKVCGVHSKSPKVIVAGIEQRFCQQCSRFHQLPEFDQGKRSCRRRLAGHNERRRKPPPPGPRLSSRYGSLSPSTFDNYRKTGVYVMDFSAYAAVAGRDPWPNATSQRGSGNEATTTITGKYHDHQLPWQSSNSQNPLTDLHHGSSSEDCFSVGISGPTSGALSLLSNQPLSLGINNFLGSNGVSIVEPSIDPGAYVGLFPCQSWGFRGNHGNSNVHEMPRDMGLAQIAHPMANGQYSGERELGLAQPSEGQYRHFEVSRGYDSSVQHMNWSL